MGIGEPGKYFTRPLISHNPITRWCHREPVLSCTLAARGIQVRPLDSATPPPPCTRRRPTYPLRPRPEQGAWAVAARCWRRTENHTARDYDTVLRLRRCHIQSLQRGPADDDRSPLITPKAASEMRNEWERAGCREQRRRLHKLAPVSLPASSQLPPPPQNTCRGCRSATTQRDIETDETRGMLPSFNDSAPYFELVSPKTISNVGEHT